MVISRVAIEYNATQISHFWQALVTKFSSLNNFSFFLRLTEILGPLFRRPLLSLLVRNGNWIAHFRVDLSLAKRGRSDAQPFVLKLVYLHVDEISFSYESMGTKTRCLKEP